MSTFAVATTYAHSVTHVTDKMLLTIKEIIREIGLDPSRFVQSWATYERGITTWLTSRHLERVTLEIYDPGTDSAVSRWDIDVVYTTVGDGSLWVDTNFIRYSIKKAGLVPSACSYALKLHNADGRPDVPGWSPCDYRSMEGFKRYSLGATIGGNGLAAQTAYWSR
jgi:hypothetical protein